MINTIIIVSAIAAYTLLIIMSIGIRFEKLETEVVKQRTRINNLEKSRITK